MQAWSTTLKSTAESQPYYEAFDERCTAPNTLPFSANIDCVKCASLPCSATCSFCEDLTLYGLSPLRSTPTYSDKVSDVCLFPACVCAR